MARSPKQTAAVLEELYPEQFGRDEHVSYRISWPELRGITGLPRLFLRYVSMVDKALRANGYVLVTFDNYFLIVGDQEFDHERMAPQRIVEPYIFDADDFDEDDELEETFVEFDD